MKEFNLPGYVLIQLLGQGSMGIVYECEQELTGRRVAVKRLHDKFTTDPKSNLYFKKEAQLIAKLKHTNIITVYNLMIHDDNYYLIMELCNGEKLSNILKERVLPLKTTLEIISSLLDGLSYAHNSGIIHHDVKPGNVILLKDETPVLCDFGLATMQRSKETGIKKSLFGTPSYMSPEKIKGKLTTRNEHLSDIFAMGVIFYQMLTGKLPFYGENKENLYQNIILTDPVSPIEINHEIPISLNAIALKLLEKNTKHRYSNAQDALKDIQNYMQGKPISVFEKSLYYKFFLRVHRNKIKTSVVFVLILSLIIISIFFMKTRGKEKSIWINEPLFKKEFSYLDIERRWTGCDPVKYKTYSLSNYSDIFTINNGTLITTPENSSLFTFNTSKPLGDFSFACGYEIKSSLNCASGIYLGEKQHHKKSSKGLFFSFNNYMFKILYPKTNGPAIFKKELNLSSKNIIIKIVRELLCLKISVNNKLIYILDLSFFPLSEDFNHIGFFSNYCNTEFQNPELLIKERPLFSSPLFFPLSVLSKGEYRLAAKEFKKLIPVLKNNKDFTTANYFAGISYLHLNRKDDALVCFDKAKAETADKYMKEKTRLISEWLKYINSNSVNISPILSNIDLKLHEKEKIFLFLILMEYKYIPEKINNPQFFQLWEKRLFEFLNYKNIDYCNFIPLIEMISEKLNSESLNKRLSFVKRVFDKIDDPSNSMKEHYFNLLLDIGKKFMKQQNYIEAFNIFQDLQTNFQENIKFKSDINKNIIECYLELPLKEKRNALDIKTTLDHAYQCVGKKEYERAITLFNDLISLYPENKELKYKVYTNIATCYFVSGKREKAQEYILKAKNALK